MTHCKSCGAAILWLPHRDTQGYARRMPIDPEPTDVGNLLLFGAPDLRGGTAWTRYSVLSGEKLAQYRANRTPLYRSHFASCPQAAEHRRRKPAAELLGDLVETPTTLPGESEGSLPLAPPVSGRSPASMSSSARPRIASRSGRE